MKGWMVFRQVLDLKERAVEIINLCRAAHSTRNTPQQSGVCLAEVDTDTLSFIGAPLERLASEILCKTATLNWRRSSFREQPPDGEGALSVHQDIAALDMIGPGLRNKKRLTIWVPLTEIDGTVPTIAVGRRSIFRLAHTADNAGYSILANPRGIYLKPLEHLEVGDVVYLHPRTPHATYIPRLATHTRYSLDMRFFAS